MLNAIGAISSCQGGNDDPKVGPVRQRSAAEKRSIVLTAPEDGRVGQSGDDDRMVTSMPLSSFFKEKSTELSALGDD